MPGIPKSKRCQSCRRRKIKCDQNWPTCTPCGRANIACSGPSTGAKFVHNGRHAVSDEEPATLSSSPASSASPDWSKPSGPVAGTSAPPLQYSMVRINSQDVEGGASYGYFRLSPGPRQYPTTVADRLSARLVAHLDRDSQRDILLNVSYLKHIPPRLGESAALRDCLAVLVSAWSNFRRGRPMDQLIVPVLYGKALRSLQRALNSRQALKCETLAAITILERVEALFDRYRSQHRTLHSKGVYSLMVKRGPPSLDDPLDVHLALENQSTLHAHVLVEGGDKFYTNPEWEETMSKARRLYANYTDESNPWSCAYSLDNCYARWPEFVHRMQDLINDPDEESTRFKAISLHEDILSVKIAAIEVGESIREKALAYGIMTESEDPESPVKGRFDFNTPEFCELFMSYVTVRALMGRMLYELSVILGSPSSTRYAEYREQCQRIWMFIPYLRQMGLIIATLFTAPFYLTYEAAEGVEKEYIMSLLRAVDEYRQRLPKGPGKAERFMINTGKAMTGRIPFPSEFVAPQNAEYD